MQDILPGVNEQYRVDQVTVSMRIVSHNREVLSTNVTKTIASHASDVFKFLDIKAQSFVFEIRCRKRTC